MISKTYSSIIFLVFICLSSLSAQVSTSKKRTSSIKTNSVCGICKDEIESAIRNNLKGIIYAYHDNDSKILTVKYKTKKTSADAIRNAITLAGYDADDLKADPQAREKLDACCRPPE